MRNGFFIGAVLAGALALVYGFTVQQPSAAAADTAKNLQVLPKNMDKKEIKKSMKAIADALGVQCDHCHDTKDMAKDTEKKKVARAMMRMVAEINGKHLKTAKTKVSCATCHRGKATPDK
jgi:hypothetical protein